MMRIKKVNIMIQVFVAFVIVAGLIITGSSYLLEIESNADINVSREQQIDMIQHQQQFFRHVFEHIELDLLQLAMQNELSAVFDQNAESMDELIEELKHFINIKQEYDQVRFIDVSGQEVVRIQNHQGKAFVVPKEKLQNKAHRYYFKETIALKPKQIFISPIDLNTENNQVQQPLKPTIRFGLPVFDSAGVVRGIFIINYRAKILLDSMNLGHHEEKAKILLVDYRGYWIKGLSTEREWGFMYKDDRDRTIEHDFPKEWQLITRSDQGQFINDKGMFTFNTIRPLEGQLSGFSSHTRFYHDDEENFHWKIIAYLPYQDLYEKISNTKSNVMMVEIILLTLLAIGCLVIVSLKLKETKQQKDIEEKNALVHDIVHTAFDGIITINRRGIITSINPSALAMFGYQEEELVNQNISLLMPSPHQQEHDNYISRYIKTREAHVIGRPREVEGLHKDGRLLTLELCVSGKEYRNDWVFVGSIRDISERKQIQAQLIKAQHMESLCTLTGGIAHDFNNLLAIIMGNTDLVAFQTDSSDPRYQKLGMISEASKKAAVLCRQMLAYSGKDGHCASSFNLSDVIEKTLISLQDSTPKDVTVTSELSDVLPIVLADTNQVHQLITALVTNAAESYEHAGNVVVRAFEISLMDEQLQMMRINETRQSGRFVQLVVEDQGCGMNEETLQKMFEPFFTTKFVGRGLGMSASYGIVRCFHGAMDVQSKPGSGTTVRVYFPVE